MIAYHCSMLQASSQLRLILFPYNKILKGDGEIVCGGLCLRVGCVCCVGPAYAACLLRVGSACAA